MPANAGDIRAGRAYVSLGADSTELEAKVKNGQSLLKQLKQGLGEESKFGNIGKILAGTGAVAGLALSARLLSSMAEGAGKFADAMNRGGLEAGRVGEELIQSLPVLGQIREAGLAIRDLWTGEAAAVKAINEEVARLNALMDTHAKVVAAGAKGYEDAAVKLREMRAEQELIGTTGPWREFLQQQLELARVQSQIRKEAEATAKAIKDAALIQQSDKKITPEQRKAQIVQELQGIPATDASLEEARRRAGTLGAGAGAFLEQAEASIRETARLRAQLQRELAAVEKIIADRDEALARAATPSTDLTRQAFEGFISQSVVIGQDFAERFWEAFVKEADKRAKQAAEIMERFTEKVIEHEKAAAQAIGNFFSGPPLDTRAHEQSHGLDVDDLLQGVAGANRQFSAAGTFNPFAAGALSGGPLTQIERHTKDTARALEDIKNRGGLTYQ